MSGCPLCWRRSTARTRSTGKRRVLRGSNRCPLRRFISRWCSSSCCPTNPEALGLAALVCLSESRRAARRTGGGAFVPLDDQDPALWDSALIARGEALLHRAHGFGRPGRYQFEAAIQSAHCSRPVDWSALRRLHRALRRVAPSLGGAVAVAQPWTPKSTDRTPVCRRWTRSCRSGGCRCGFSRPGRRAHLLARAGRAAAAVAAYQRAIDLTTDAAVAERPARAAGRAAVRFAERAVDARPGRRNSQTEHARRSVMG